MGVEVDDARCEDKSFRVDLALSLVADVADGADAPVADRDVGPGGIVAEAVDDGGSADDELIHGGFSRRTAVGTDAAASGCDPRVWRMQGSAQDRVW